MGKVFRAQGSGLRKEEDCDSLRARSTELHLSCSVLNTEHSKAVKTRVVMLNTQPMNPAFSLCPNA